MSDLFYFCWYLILNLTPTTYLMMFLSVTGIQYLLFLRKSSKPSAQKLAEFKTYCPLTCIVVALAYYGILVDIEALGDQNMKTYSTMSCAGNDSDECNHVRNTILMLKEFNYSPNEAAL